MGSASNRIGKGHRSIDVTAEAPGLDQMPCTRAAQECGVHVDDPSAARGDNCCHLWTGFRDDTKRRRWQL